MWSIRAIALASGAVAKDLWSVARDGDVTSLEALLGTELKSAVANDREPSTGQTPLLAAVAAGQDEVVSLLLARGADPEIPDATGVTPMLLAAREGKASVVDPLAQRGVAVDALEDGLAPLHWACRGASPEHAETVRALLHAGADPHLRASNGEDCAAMTRNDATRAVLEPWLAPSLDTAAVLAAALSKFASSSGAQAGFVSELKECLPAGAQAMAASGMEEGLHAMLTFANIKAFREGFQKVAQMLTALSATADALCSASSNTGAASFSGAAEQLAEKLGDRSLFKKFKSSVKLDGKAITTIVDDLQKIAAPDYTPARPEALGHALGEICALFAVPSGGKKRAEL